LTQVLGSDKARTTRFHSFTDRNIPSVCDSAFVGKFFTDDIPKGKRPSAFLSSVIPNSVAKSVSKKNIFRWFYKQKLPAKKNVSHLKYTNGLIPSVIMWNTDQRYPSVYSSVIVATTVKCRRTNFVCKFISMIDISRSLSNADGYSLSVKPSVIIFKYVFKKLFRIHNIKLYKLIVKKINYANKIFIKHQKQKNKVK